MICIMILLLYQLLIADGLDCYYCDSIVLPKYCHQVTICGEEEVSLRLKSTAFSDHYICKQHISKQSVCIIPIIMLKGFVEN